MKTVIREILTKIQDKIQVIEGKPCIEFEDIQVILGGYALISKFKTGQIVKTKQDVYSHKDYDKSGAKNIGRETFEITKILYYPVGWLVYGVSDKSNEEVWHNESDVELIALKKNRKQGGEMTNKEIRDTEKPRLRTGDYSPFQVNAIQDLTRADERSKVIGEIEKLGREIMRDKWTRPCSAQEYEALFFTKLNQMKNQ